MTCDGKHLNCTGEVDDCGIALNVLIQYAIKCVMNASTEKVQKTNGLKIEKFL